MEPALIDERIKHLLALLAACRTILVANVEAGHPGYSGAIALLDEMEPRIRYLAELLP